MKVKLHFTLVGKTDQWKKYIKSNRDGFTNADNLDYVKGMVNDQFGERPLFIASENMLIDAAITYPKYFSAGWFVSEDNLRTELVIIGHGENMSVANKTMMDAIKTIDWTKLSAKI